MQSLQLAQSHSFEMIDTEIPSVNPGYAVLRFQYAMVCGSDAPKYDGSWEEYPAPLSPGMPIHECVGRVVTSGIQGLEPGVSVLAMPEGDCGLSDLFLTSEKRMTPLFGWDQKDLQFAPLGQLAGAVLFGFEDLAQSKEKQLW